MKFDDNARIDEGDVQDIRGAGPARGRAGGGAAMRLGGGGVGIAVIVMIIAKLTGVDLSALLGGGGGAAPASRGQAAPSAQSNQAAPPANDPDPRQTKFIKQTMTDIQDTFDAAFREHNLQYQRATLVLFTQAVDTGCGLSSSEIGPFYCPPDSKAYIDLTFFDELHRRFGAPGDFAQAYVLAHEIGHHLQNLLNVEEAARRVRGKSKNEISVMQELQADCYAGVWGNSAKRRGILDMGDLEEAITAAQAIGDDRLQKQAGMRPNAETFTHGTSAQRMKWFRVGYDSGKLDSCDTFAPGAAL